MRRRGLGYGFLAAWLLVGCTPEGPPDILLVTLDTLRPDHLGVYGYDRETSPFIDSLAADGVVFDNAYAPMGTTSPSHATLFTARSPLAHGVVRNGLSLGHEEATLAERLSAAGYDTAAFVSSFPVARRFGFAQGFDHFDDDFSLTAATVPMKRWEGVEVTGHFDRRAHVTRRAVVEWLAERDSSAPLFLWVHLFDPHDPYLPPRPLRDRFLPEDATAGERLIAHYDAEILHADQQLAQIVEAFEAASPDRRHLILLAGDHGEGHEDHGWGTHNWNPYEEEVRIPLILKFDGVVEAGERRTTPVHLGDVLPTLAGVAGLDLGDLGEQGRSIWPLDDSEDPERPIFVMRPEYENGRPLLGQRGPGRAIRSGRWKYFEAPNDPRVELYDLERDPGEQDNLAESHGPERERLAAMLEAWVAGELAGRSRPAVEVPEDVRAGLEALGYSEDGLRD